MVGKQFEGYPPVQRLVRDHIYLFTRQHPWEYTCLGLFFKKEHNGTYVFKTLAQNDSRVKIQKIHPTQGYSLVKALGFSQYIREVAVEDLPLFINYSYIYPAYKEIMQGDHLILKHRAKVRRHKKLH